MNCLIEYVVVVVVVVVVAAAVVVDVVVVALLFAKASMSVDRIMGLFLITSESCIDIL